MTPKDTSARLLEQRTVSRKTPGDGKLEVTKPAAASMESLGAEFGVAVGDRSGAARLGSMPCTCRGGDQPHVHYFVESDLFRSLTAGESVTLFVDDKENRLLVQRG